MKKYLFVTSFCLLFFFIPSHLGAFEWLKNYELALEKGKKEKKPLLLFFCGSDWSGWCMKIKKEVLDSSAFSNAIGSRLIGLEIDFPHHSIQLPEIEKQNLALKEQMEISDFPHFILMYPEGRILLRTGYLSGEPEQVAQYLLSVLEKDKELTKVIESLKEKKFSGETLEQFYHISRELRRNEEAKQLLEEGLLCQENQFFLFEKYKVLLEEEKHPQEIAKVRKTLSDRDPLNEKGTQFSLAMIEFQDLSKKIKANSEVKIHTVVAPLRHYLVRFGKSDPDNVWRLEMMMAQAYLNNDESNRALKHAKLALESAPQEKKEEIASSIEYIQNQLG